MVDNIVDNSIDESYQLMVKSREKSYQYLGLFLFFFSQDTGACILLVSSWATIFFFGNQISPTSANNRSRIRVWILAILFWFLLRSGREYESPVSDSEKSSPQFLSYFSIPPSFCRQSVEPNSNPPFKEQNAHVASVKYILGSHASYLMSGKELSKLVAFVKGTQFDLVAIMNSLNRLITSNSSDSKEANGEVRAVRDQQLIHRASMQRNGEGINKKLRTL